jgi:hypothetical protein
MKYKIILKPSSMYPNYPIAIISPVTELQNPSNPTGLNPNNTLTKQKAIKECITLNQNTLSQINKDHPKKYFKPEHSAYYEIEQTFKILKTELENNIKNLQKELKLKK